MAIAVGERDSDGEGGWAPKVHPHEDLCTRTSWADARTALAHINKGRATGSRAALWVRTKLQVQLLQLGLLSARHAGKVIFVALLLLATFCVGLKSAKLVTDVEQLWVEEGGRLEEELQYVRESVGEGSGTTQQMVILTPKHEGASVLHPRALLAHSAVLTAATKVKVDMFDISWGLKDICSAPSFPIMDDHLIEQILERITPCIIITPLDCFWEGSKLLGPEYPVTIPGLGSGVRWTNLNPQTILDKMQLTFPTHSPVESFAAFMKRAGITTAYQEKPCLDPSDPECPETAPNKHSKQSPDIGAELTGGCYGFASKYMHWPQQLIVGAPTPNKTGHIVRAEALQSIVQLMGPRTMYEFWEDQYRVHHVDWSIEKASQILEAWQNKFTEAVLEEAERLHNHTRPYNLLPFTSAALTHLLTDFSQVPVLRVALGYAFMVIYACISLSRISDSVKSAAGLGLSGVLLVAVSVAAGLGLCAVLGLPFNAATTQVLPFLALGLGVDDMFLLAHTFVHMADDDGIPYHERVGEVVKRAGVSVVLTSVCNVGGFLAGSLVPVPALRCFCQQAAILLLVNLLAALTVFPALMTLDLRRRRARRPDILCCLSPVTQHRALPMHPLTPSGAEEGRVRPPRTQPPISDPRKTTVTRALPPPGGGTVTQVVPPCAPRECWAPTSPAAPSLESIATNTSTRDLVSSGGRCAWLSNAWAAAIKALCGWSIGGLAAAYGATLTHGAVKAAAVLGLAVSVAGAAWGVSRVTDGLALTEVVPASSPEHAFLTAQHKYFGFYNLVAVTGGDVEYPRHQQLLHQYHQAFARVTSIIKNDDGGLPEFWLSLFRDWLSGLQVAFDREWSEGRITQDKWHPNASDDGILAYKLLVQTGHVDNPIDVSLINQVRLVDSDGIINPKAFYNYLTAWVNTDSLAYSASQGDLRPEPRHWSHDRYDKDLRIPKSQPLVYTQLPFYLHQLGDTESITDMIHQVRTICTKYYNLGLPNFPTGVPFTFWEQYIKLRFYLVLALLAVLTAVFVVLAVVLMNIWASAMVVLLLATLVLQLFGILGILGIRLSAVPAVLLIISVGVGVEFCVHVTVGFLTSVGGRDRRVVLALQHMAAPVLHGAASTLIASIMLLFSEFDFIRRYFFYVLLALTVFGVLDGLVFLPVLLSLLGPPAEVVPRNHTDRLPTPSPPPSPQPQTHAHSTSRRSSGRSTSTRGMRRNGNSNASSYARHHGSNLSLTTITEEPSSSTRSSQSLKSSHEIVVEPQVVVETTTSPASTTTERHDHHVTTKVTATAKVKVELHTPLPGAIEPTYRTSSSSGSRRSSRRSSRGDTTAPPRTPPSPPPSPTSSSGYSDVDEEGYK